MMSRNGRRRPSVLSNQLLSGSLVVQSTSFSLRSRVSLSLGKLSRTVVVNFEPSISSPEMLLLPLVSVNSFTLSFSTNTMNSV